MKGARPLWPLAAAFLVFLVTCGFTFRKSIDLTGGSLIYPMDDAYIHMAMAKNLSQHGVWGITRFEFNSASSSLLWTLLLALAFKLAGVREFAPLVLSFTASFAALAWMDRCFRRYGVGPQLRLFALLATTFCTPLPMLAFSGMEHAAHTLLTLIFVSLFCEFALERRDLPALAIVCAAAALVCLARYEGLFLVAVACGILLARSAIREALLLACSSLLPLVGFAMISLHYGSYAVPNSVLLKAMLQPGMSLGGFARFAFLFAIEAPKAPHLLFVIFLSAVLLAFLVEQERSLWNIPALSIFLFLCGSVIHLEFARTGWLYRYEAYLVAFGIYVCALGFHTVRVFTPRYFRRPVAATVAAVGLICFGYAFFERAFGSLWLIPWASKNIYDEQYQTAIFIRNYYPGRTVVLHDIGAAAFLNECPIIDVFGLGSIEVARARRSGAFNAAWIDSFARSKKAAIAVTYDTWMSLDSPPQSWQDIGYWAIRDNQICWRDAMHFYAIASGERGILREDLRLQSESLPPGVKPVMKTPRLAGQ